MKYRKPVEAVDTSSALGTSSHDPRGATNARLRQGARLLSGLRVIQPHLLNAFRATKSSHKKFFESRARVAYRVPSWKFLTVIAVALLRGWREEADDSVTR